MPDIHGKRWLMIDDQRDYNADRTARTYEDGIIALQEENWDVLMLDHDLDNPDPAKTGYQICNWLQQNPQWQPREIQLITSNPVGRDRMALALTNMGYTEIIRGLQYTKQPSTQERR
jgi:CheY-like chemotaxis protein